MPDLADSKATAIGAADAADQGAAQAPKQRKPWQAPAIERIEDDVSATNVWPPSHDGVNNHSP